jgi:hypothetical protein
LNQNSFALCVKTNWQWNCLKKKKQVFKSFKKVKIRSGILEKKETNLFYSSKIRFFPIWKILLRQKLVASISKVRRRFIFSHYSIKTFIDPKKTFYLFIVMMFICTKNSSLQICIYSKHLSQDNQLFKNITKAFFIFFSFKVLHFASVHEFFSV